MQLFPVHSNTVNEMLWYVLINEPENFGQYGETLEKE